jgi:acetyl-CoA acetyltransferase/uncharacterized OB-fold protein
VRRPLPQPSLASTDWWKAGADGVLQMTHCDGCDRFFHPPMPICPYCRSREVGLKPVSGRATVIGVTVNHQPWTPDFPPPYVIAVVAIAEDDGARLTTNIVNCAAEDVVIGLQVKVLFEHSAPDVWTPLFEPDPERPELLPLAPPRDITAGLRSPASTERFEHKVALTGVGQSQVGRRLMLDPLSLTVDACTRAVEDAGLTFDDIDGLSTYPGANMAGMSEGGIMPLEAALNIRPVWLNGGADLPGQNGSIYTAMLAVAAGLCRHVLCFRTMWQASETALLRSGQLTLPSGPSSGMMEWLAPFGALSATSWIGAQASQYDKRYGGVREAMGQIAVAQRAGAVINPEAILRDPLTLDDYFNARMISTPLNLLDCDLPCDGAIAIVVSAIDAAHDGPNPPVFVEATGTQTMERFSWDQDTMDHLPQAQGAGAHLWTRTSMTPADVDVALLYDGFSFNALSWMEGLGFCGIGEAPDFIGDGSRLRLGGELPLNPHGGQLSAGRLHGYGFAREAMLQLRGQAGARQVAGARVAVAAAGGGTPSGCMLLRAD